MNFLLFWSRVFQLSVLWTRDLNRKCIRHAGHHVNTLCTSALVFIWRHVNALCASGLVFIWRHVNALCASALVFIWRHVNALCASALVFIWRHVNALCASALVFIWRPGRRMNALCFFNLGRVSIGKLFFRSG